ncbi:MAG: undecaprenyl/decaprenyl-phosphate alpha-N-acetylglucosaminyl 1-phosphate transferase [Firmicutes bacterium]|nr:undecaprenyl/decaprenyl-phosphate alpha-N-acetylglucosaminyl 1-phosphate transferase [Bacillota bacterium]
MVSFVVSLLMTPVAIKIAPKIGAIDVPKDGRRMHTKAMPRFGGLAIFAGTTVSMAIFLTFDQRVLGIMIGGILIYILGVLDDLRNLPAKVKFMGQIAIAIIMYMYDIRIEFITNFFGEGKSYFGAALCFVITILWIVGITNTVNLIDGLDGLAAGTSALASLCIAYVAYIHGMYLVAGSMLALAGGALGFLPFNFYPAKIFMGDGGSLYLGFMLATLSILGPVKSATIVAVIIPVLVLGLPIFDTAFAIFRRVVNKRPIMEADKGHLHHRLMSLGYGQRRATLMLYCVSGIMGVAAVTYSRGLWVETIGLFLIAFLMIYIFLTDATSAVPKIKQHKTVYKKKAELVVEEYNETEDDI